MSYPRRRISNRLYLNRMSAWARTPLSSSRRINGRLQKPARPTTPTSRPSKVLNKKPPRGYDKPRWDSDEAKAAQKTKLADKRARQAEYKKIKDASKARQKDRKVEARREEARIAGQPFKDRIAAKTAKRRATKERILEERATRKSSNKARSAEIRQFNASPEGVKQRLEREEKHKAKIAAWNARGRVSVKSYERLQKKAKYEAQMQAKKDRLTAARPALEARKARILAQRKQWNRYA